MVDLGYTYDASGWLSNYGPFSGAVQGVVIHSLECDAIAHIAEQLSARGGWLDTEGLAPQRMTDPVSIVRCVPEVYSAGHIGGPGNQHFVGVEVSGRAAWVRSQWLDGGSAQAALEHQARAVAGLYILLGHSYGEIRWLSLAQLRAGSPFGMCSHNDITLSGVSQTTHWDPGLGFPFDWFLTRVQAWFLSMTGAAPVITVDGTSHAVIPVPIPTPVVTPPLEDIMLIVTDGSKLGTLNSAGQFFWLNPTQWAGLRAVFAKMKPGTAPPTVTITPAQLAQLPVLPDPTAALDHIVHYIDGNPGRLDGAAHRAITTLQAVKSPQGTSW